jgi:hypothetical protein
MTLDQINKMIESKVEGYKKLKKEDQIENMITLKKGDKDVTVTDEYAFIGAKENLDLKKLKERIKKDEKDKNKK